MRLNRNRNWDMVADVVGVSDVADGVSVHGEVVQEAWLDVSIDAVQPAQGGDNLVSLSRIHI